jgi:uncharacterized protein YjbI with pentapeptide repeats
MMKRILISATLLLFTLGVHAGDLGFRYQSQSGKCVNDQGQEGLNPGNIGQCGDLRGVVISRLNLDSMDLSGSRFDSSDVQGTILSHTNLTGVQFTQTNLSGVDLTGAIIHSTGFTGAILLNTQFSSADIQSSDFTDADLSGAQLSYMRFSGSTMTRTKLANAGLDYSDLSQVDLSGAVLTGANLQNSDLSKATLNGTDLSGASMMDANLSMSVGQDANMGGAVLRKAILKGAKLKGLVLRRAQLEGADLSGADLSGSDLRSANLTDTNTSKTIFTNATFNKGTLLPFTIEDGQSKGMIFKNLNNLFIIWDESQDFQDIQDIKRVLGEEGVEITMSSKSHREFTGEDIDEQTVILHLLGSAYNNEMPEAGQVSLVNFVKNGGTYIGTAWGGYMVMSQGFLQKMKDLVLIRWDNGNEGDTNRSITAVQGMESHPLLADVSFPITMNAGFSLGAEPFQFTENPVLVLARDNEGMVTVGIRNFGEGKVIGFGFSSKYSDRPGGFVQKPVQQLLMNALAL